MNKVQAFIEANKRVFVPLTAAMIILAGIAVIGYFVSIRNPIASIRSFAANITPCTNGSMKREDTIWYDCINGRWVPRSTTSTGSSGASGPSTGTTGGTKQNCSITKSGSYWYINGVSCRTPTQSTVCNGVEYCCPSVGGKWAACSSSTIKQPPKPNTNTTATTQTGTNQLASGTNKQQTEQIFGGGKQCPPQQKKGATTKPKTSKQQGTQQCKDYGCSNVKQGSNWGIINCDSGDPDGDMQLCNAKGRIGLCGGKQLCCPGPGQQWTADMTACPVTTATLSVSPTSMAAGQLITVTYAGCPAPSSKDWIGVYKQGETDERDPITWGYTHSTGACTQTEGDGKAGGSCTLRIPANTPAGSYEFRLFSSDTFSKLAVSTPVAVSAPTSTPTNTPTTTPTQTPTTTLTGTPSITPAPTAPCCACPTPTPNQSSCNGPCLTSANCGSGQICLLMDSYGWVCRNPACVNSYSCSCTASTPTATPSPTPSITPTPTSPPIGGAAVCGEICTSHSQCRSGYKCVYVDSNSVAVCRNSRCLLSSTCVCPITLATGTPRSTATPYSTPLPTGPGKGTDLDLTPTPTGTASATISATPTPTLLTSPTPTILPTPTPEPVKPALSVKPFTDSTGKAPAKFTLSGTSDPYAQVTVHFEPDALGQTTTADAKGNWRYILTKSLSSGNKELTVTATNAEGGQAQIKQSFTAKAGGGSFFSLFIAFALIAILGGVGFFIYQRQMNDQSTLFSQFPPIPSSPTESQEAPPVASASQEPETQPSANSDIPEYSKPDFSGSLENQSASQTQKPDQDSPSQS